MFLSDSRRHSFQFAPRVFDVPLRLFLPRTIHLRQRFGQPPVGATQDGRGHLQFALQRQRGRARRRRWALRFQKQFRLGEDALAHHARAVAPGGIEHTGLAIIATVLDETGCHSFAVFDADSGHWHEIFHCQLRGDRAFAHLLLNDFRQGLGQRQSARHPA